MEPTYYEPLMQLVLGAMCILSGLILFVTLVVGLVAKAKQRPSTAIKTIRRTGAAARKGIDRASAAYLWQVARPKKYEDDDYGW